MTTKFFKKVVTAITIATGVLTINMMIFLCYAVVQWLPNENLSSVSSVRAAGRSDIGVVTFTSSLPKSSDKKTTVEKATEAGFGWAREEYTYSGDMNWAPYDAAYSYLRGGGLRILGLLTYPAGGSHDA